MKNIILFDKPEVRGNLLPITFTRPIAAIRIGITTIREKWQSYFHEDSFSYWTAEFLSPKFATNATDDNYFIAGHIIPDKNLVNSIENLQPGEVLQTPDGYNIIAFRGTLNDFERQNQSKIACYEGNFESINWLYDIFSKNDEILKEDFKAITTNRKSQPLSDTNTIIGEQYFEDGTPKYSSKKVHR